MNRGRPPVRQKVGIVRILFVLFVVGFAGWYAYTSLMPSGYKTALIESGSIGGKYVGDALIVRNETPYDAEGVTSIDYIAEEGNKVYRGDMICNVYSAGYNAKELTSLQNYRDQIKTYHRTLIDSESTYDQKMSRLESEVMERALEVRSLVQGERGNMLNQEKILDTAITTRQNYLRQKYADDQRLSRLYDDEETQTTRIQSWTKQYSAAIESIISFYADGYEYGLTSTNFEGYSPAEVRAMFNGQVPEKTTAQKGRTTIYRTVRENSWNVLLLLSEPAWNPEQGKTYQIKLEGFDNTIVDATVSSFTRASGELLIRLDVRSDVTPVLYMRTCQAELGEYVNSMKVPTKAIYSQGGKTGVVTMDAQGFTAFVEVQIVSTDSEGTFIAPVQQGLLYVGQQVLLF